MKTCNFNQIDKVGMPHYEYKTKNSIPWCKLPAFVNPIQHKVS